MPESDQGGDCHLLDNVVQCNDMHSPAAGGGQFLDTVCSVLGLLVCVCVRVRVRVCACVYACVCAVIRGEKDNPI